jgi:monoamine oxidase
MHQANCHCPACCAGTLEVLEFTDRGVGGGKQFESEAIVFDRGAQNPGGPSSVAPSSCSKKMKGLSVAVVGGGFAGLMAARTLCRQGAEVTVFEARSQVGGRVQSDYGSFSKGRITELGAELVGSIHTRWCGLAIEYGLSLVNRMDAELYRGQQLKVAMVLDKALDMDQMRALEKEKIARVLLPIAKLASRIKDPSRPWDEAWLKPYDALSVADQLAKPTSGTGYGQGYGVSRSERLWKAMELLLVNNNVKRLEELNFLGLLCLVRGGQFGTINRADALMGYWNELEIYRCADGCQTLAFRIASDIQSSKYRCQVLLRRAVSRIELDKPLRGKTVSITSRPVQVMADGKVVLGAPKAEGFDRVIFAIPPSVWSDVDIKPTHPATALGLMEMGDAVKFFTDLKERFWLKTRQAPYGGSLALGQVWEGTDNQSRIGDQGVVLSVFAGGRKPMPTEKDFRRELKILYTDYPAAPRTRFANWPEQPFIRAGYVSPGKNQIFKVGKALNEPFLGRLFFAGEHTQMDHFGYMEGALRSGERAANLLMQQVCAAPALVAEHIGAAESGW